MGQTTYHFLFFTFLASLPLRAQDITSHPMLVPANKNAFSLDSWLKITLPLVNETVAIKTQEAAIKSLGLTQEQVVRQTPFSTSTQLYGQSYQKPAVGISLLELAQNNSVEAQSILDANLQANPYPDRFVGLSQSLTYRNWDGVNAQLQAGLTYGNYFEGVAEVPNRYNYSVNGTIAYDVVQGGHNSPANLEAQAQAMSLEAQRLSVISMTAAMRVSFFRLMVDVYNAKCNVDLIARLRGKVDEAVSTGKVQLESNTISYTDYLNYLNLKTSFEQFWLQQQTNLEALLAQTGGWSVDIRKNIELHLRHGITCDFQFDEAVAGDNVLSATQDIESLVTSHPDFRSNQLIYQASKVELDALKTRQKISFGPYVGVNYAQDYFNDNGMGDLQGGLTLAYTPPGAQGRYAVEAAQIALKNRKLIIAKAQLIARAQLQRLRQLITRQKKVVSLAKENLKTSNELIDTLETQRSLGFSNSLNYAQSYLNHIENISSFLQSVSSLKKNINELKIYQQVASAAKEGTP